MHVEDLFLANLCLNYLTEVGTMERLCLQHFQKVNKTSSFKTTLIGRLNCKNSALALMFNFPTFKTADVPLEITAWPTPDRIQNNWKLYYIFVSV